jgi:hypothetical protein
VLGEQWERLEATRGERAIAVLATIHRRGAAGRTEAPAALRRALA